MNALHIPQHHVRIVTASSLFDGHDAAINVMRRTFQSQGCEVIHLGHNRSVREVVDAVVDEDVHVAAVSSYQGGHIEYFEYLVAALRERGMEHVRVVGGGGGVIVPEEIERLGRSGVTIFSPDDGMRMGIAGMVNSVVAAGDHDLWTERPARAVDVIGGDRTALSRAVTGAEGGRLHDDEMDLLRIHADELRPPVLGITGTGGSGKSSLTDELIRRFRRDDDDALRIAVIAVDPSRRRGGGALLGDRIRMNALDGDRVFFRSLSTRGAHELPDGFADVMTVIRAGGFDLVIIETPGIGQGDAAIVPHVDASLYVMTPEFGASSQLEKIDMLDFADAVAVNKFERRGAEDALRDVARQLMRNREAFGEGPDAMPVFGTRAAAFNDDGVTGLYHHLRGVLVDHGLRPSGGGVPSVHVRRSSGVHHVVPVDRERYLSEISGVVRAYHADTDRLADAARRVQRLAAAHDDLVAHGEDAEGVSRLLEAVRRELPGDVRDQIAGWHEVVALYTSDDPDRSEGGDATAPFAHTSPSGTRIPRVAIPRLDDHGDLVRFWRSENLPGRFPFTAGVFPFRRDDEEPARMFAGEGDPHRTNRRFHILAAGSRATRLSTAFDSVTLYGRDPDPRPDVYGKVGTSGVSVATLDDMRVLYDGFDLLAPSTSVSMTINGPAPTVLAFFLNTAIDQAVDAFVAREGRDPSDEERASLTTEALATVRGTVQADILKEDQGQNTCLFSTEFGLRMMADVQEWFIQRGVRNFYSVSISGYHIAEAGANPVTQLAFTLANAFTYVEAYLARGMHVDDFAPSLSFFFSSGMDPEYSVIGRVARRIWAIALRDHYGAGERAQRLKYHVQTSGRSLHAQEMAFNDIRTTLQALTAVYDNANSLHTNAYDEAVTTPSEESVRRALAIQLVINREWGLAMNENPMQGAFIIDELTDLVEAAVLDEFDRITSRGGVLGAMETGYQRGRIQDESMAYEVRKHDGSLPIVGVNTFLPAVPDEGADPAMIPLARATDEERRSQLERVRAFRDTHADAAQAALTRLTEAALAGENTFGVLMDAARVCSLGQVTEALFDVGGDYRRTV